MSTHRLRRARRVARADGCAWPAVAACAASACGTTKHEPDDQHRKSSQHVFVVLHAVGGVRTRVVANGCRPGLLQPAAADACARAPRSRRRARAVRRKHRNEPGTKRTLLTCQELVDHHRDVTSLQRCDQLLHRRGAASFGPTRGSECERLAMQLRRANRAPRARCATHTSRATQTTRRRQRRACGGGGACASRRRRAARSRERGRATPPRAAARRPSSAQTPTTRRAAFAAQTSSCDAGRRPSTGRSCRRRVAPPVCSRTPPATTTARRQRAPRSSDRAGPLPPVRPAKRASPARAACAQHK